MMTQRGFSIAQVSIAMAMMSIMSIGLTTMVQNQANTIYYLEDQMSHQNFKKEVESILSDTTVCSESLDNVRLPKGLIQANPNSGTNFVIKDSSGQTLFDPSNNNKNKFDNLRITDIRVQNLDVTDPVVGGSAIIKIDLERARGRTRQALKSISIQKSVSLDSSYNIVNCSGGNNEGWGECLENSGGTYLGRPGFSGPINTQAMVPNSAKAIKVSLPGGSCSGGSSRNNNDWTGVLLPAELVIPLNGKVVINGTALTAGGVLTLGGRLQNEVYYRGQRLVTISGCSAAASNHTLHIPSSNLPFCHKTTDYRGPSSSHFGNRFNTVPASISFWD